jgi:CSLREA domain-containing protein
MSTIKSFFRIWVVLLVLTSMPGSTFNTQGVSPAYAASLTVNSLADTVAVDGNCTLREAIQNANNDAATNADCPAGSGADTITFSVSGTITLDSSLPMITDAAGLTVDGASQAVTISGDNASKIIYIQINKTLILNNLTITNGTSDTFGGGISNYGALAITNSTVSGNNADLGGGGIYTTGALTITNSTISNNSALGSHNGGGVYIDNGSVTISNSTFSGNSASGGMGGGIFYVSASGDLIITNSTFTNNSASLGSGGGIYHMGDMLSITNSTFSGNSANYGNGGGIYNTFYFTLRQSTFTGNSAESGGGIYTTGYLTLANSTFSNNSATATGSNGGGILNASHGDAAIYNSTFSGNSVPGSGSSLGNASGTVTLRNTIVANAVTGSNCSGAITNGGSNLEDGTTCGWGSTAGSKSNTNPLLGALTGSPAYFPLGSGSPAINAGDNPVCAAWPVNNLSQNGLTRPQGAHCDIGSYEAVDTNPPEVLTITRLDPSSTSASSIHFLITFSKDVTGVDTGDFALDVVGITGASITEVSGGTKAYTVTVDTGSGIGTIRLNVVDNDSIVDMASTPLGGAGAGNGNYSGGETYYVRYTQTYTPLIIKE